MKINIFKAIYDSGQEYIFIAQDYQEAYIFIKQKEEQKLDGKRDFNIAHVFEDIGISP